MFPFARFIHIVRDVKDVIHSMLYFEGRSELGVSCPSSALDYWIKAVSACCAAEAELGADVVHRVRYEDLVNNSEKTLKEIFAFLEEPFSSRALGPLTRRINGSQFPAVAEEVACPQSDAMTAACLLSDGLKAGLPAEALLQSSSGLADQFDQRVEYLATLEDRIADELDARAAWALRLDSELAQKGAYIRSLQEELAVLRQQPS